MGYKAFCDYCGEETTRNYAGEGRNIAYDGWQISVTVMRRGNGQDVLCEKCLLEIVHQGADRPVTRGAVAFSKE